MKENNTVLWDVLLDAAERDDWEVKKGCGKGQIVWLRGASDWGVLWVAEEEKPGQFEDVVTQRYKVINVISRDEEKSRRLPLSLHTILWAYLAKDE